MGRLGGHDGTGGRLGLGLVAVDLDGLVQVFDAPDLAPVKAVDRVGALLRELV